MAVAHGGDLGEMLNLLSRTRWQQLIYVGFLAAAQYLNHVLLLLNVCALH